MSIKLYKSNLFCSIYFGRCTKFKKLCASHSHVFRKNCVACVQERDEKRQGRKIQMECISLRWFGNWSIPAYASPPSQNASLPLTKIDHSNQQFSPFHHMPKDMTSQGQQNFTWAVFWIQPTLIYCEFTGCDYVSMSIKDFVVILVKEA